MKYRKVSVRLDPPPNLQNWLENAPEWLRLYMRTQEERVSALEARVEALENTVQQRGTARDRSPPLSHPPSPRSHIPNRCLPVPQLPPIPLSLSSSSVTVCAPRCLSVPCISLSSSTLCPCSSSPQNPPFPCEHPNSPAYSPVPPPIHPTNQSTPISSKRRYHRFSFHTPTPSIPPGPPTPPRPPTPPHLPTFFPPVTSNPTPSTPRPLSFRVNRRPALYSRSTPP